MAADVYIRESSNYSVEIHASQNLQEIIKTKVKGDRLIIELKNNKCLKGDSDVEVYISAPNFEVLSVSGAGTIFANNKLNSPNLDLLNKLDLNFRYALGEHFDLFAGPSFNVYLSQHDPETESAALNVPYNLFTHDWGNNEGQTYLWIGANAAVNAAVSVKF